MAALVVSVGSVSAQSDVAFYAVFKNQIFEQDNPFVPALREESYNSNEQPISFGVFIATTGSNKVTSASVQTPGGSSVNVPPNDGGDSSLNLTQGFEHRLELDATYGDGTYTVTINAVNDGQRVIGLNLSGDAYPSTPRYSNLTAARAIDHTADFTLTWDAMAGGTAGDIVMVEIQQEGGNGDSEVFASPSPGEAGQLTGLNTSVVIPANTLAAGREYQATIRFIKPTAMDSTYASGLAGYMKETQTQLRTAGAGPTDTQAPNLNGSYPFVNASDVADISVVTFEFSEPMDTAVPVADAINWTGVSNPVNFSYSWSADGKRLYCQYTPTLPLSATVGWTLNPNGSTAKLRDVAGNNLPDGFTGSFTTKSTTSAGQTDVLGLLVAKALEYTQTNATPIALGRFAASVEADLRGYATARGLDLSGPSGGPFAAELDHGDSLELEAQYALKSDLDTFFPNGRYTNVFNTVHDGTKTIVLEITQDAYPNTPTLQNFSGLAAVNAGVALNLQWDAFTGGTASDFIVLEIDNDAGRTIYETSGPLEPGFLDGTATSVSIPAHTLAPGRTYECELTFGKVVDTDTTSYSGVKAIAVFAKITAFELKTTGSPIVPTLEAMGISNNQFQLRLHGEYRRIYSVQSTQDFSNWQDVFSSNADTSSTNGMGTVVITDFGSQGSNRRFYRAYEGFPQNQGQGGGSN